MNPALKLGIIWGVVFLILLPVVLNINFLHNDDAHFYVLVEKFSRGDFSLEKTTAPTFYAIGFTALLFSNIFGMENLAVLTLLVSILSLFFLSLIILEYFNYSLRTSLLISSILFVNPLFIFTSIGFMTDNYFLLFLLVSFYFLLKFDKSENKSLFYFVLANIFIVVSYFCRQVALVTPLAFLIYLMYKRNFKYAVVQGVLFLALIIYHFFFFPKTGEMLENKFVFSNLTYFRHFFTVTYAILIYIAALNLPLFFVYIKRSFPNTIKLRAGLTALTATIIWLFGLYFNPLGWVGERFYYLKYTVGRKGFFVEGFAWDTVKGGFPFYDEIYNIWDITSKVLLIMFAILLAWSSRGKKLINIFSIYILGYVAIMNISIKVYDRYLLPLFPISILFVLSLLKIPPSFKEKIVIGVFSLFLGFYTYNYAADYYAINSYAWGKAMELHKTENVPLNSIAVSPAWRHMYGEIENRPYKFGYSCGDPNDTQNQYKVREFITISYPLRFWSENKFYMCELVNPTLD